MRSNKPLTTEVRGRISSKNGDHMFNLTLREAAIALGASPLSATQAVRKFREMWAVHEPVSLRKIILALETILTSAPWGVYISLQPVVPLIDSGVPATVRGHGDIPLPSTGEFKVTILACENINTQHGPRRVDLQFGTHVLGAGERKRPAELNLPESLQPPAYVPYRVDVEALASFPDPNSIPWNDPSWACSLRVYYIYPGMLHRA